MSLSNGIVRGPSAAQIAMAIRSGTCPDDDVFDRFLPQDLRRVSGLHWTPLVVALRAARWLELSGIREVVDLGSGAGKFCVAAALASRCSFVGLEQRPRFVDARELSRRFGVEDRVQFVQATLDQRAIPSADAYYLYNPFGENLFGPDEHLGDDVDLSPERYERDIAQMEAFFQAAPAGTFVIKYNGFGGRLPPSYEKVLVDYELPSLLRMWCKGATTDR